MSKFYSNLHFLQVKNLFHLACIKSKLELACRPLWNLLYITFKPVRITTFRSISNRIIKLSLKCATLHVKSLYNFSHCTSLLHSLISWIWTIKVYTCYKHLKDDSTAHLGFKDRLIVTFKSFKHIVVIHINILWCS